MNGIFNPPQLDITANGIPLVSAAIRGLESVRVQQRLSLPSLCELTFTDPPGPLDVLGELPPGTMLRVSVRDRHMLLFAGQVTAVEHVYEPSHRHVVRVRSYDVMHSLRKRQSVRALVQVTPAELAQELVIDLGVTVEADEQGPLWQHLIQHRQSDFDLLVEATDRCGLYFTLRDTTLHLLTLAGNGEPVPLVLGETLLEARIEENADRACRSVSTSGWDPLRVGIHGGQALNARSGREVAAEIQPAAVGGSGKRILVGEVTPDDEHAEGLAQAELDRRVAHEVTLWGVAAGDPRLQPGIPVEISGVADTVAGRYILTEVNHIFNERLGFVSELGTQPPPAHQRSHSTAATLGIVTEIDDPENKGRAKVLLPAYDKVETDWMPVMMMGAGADKGLVMMPDVGDQVLVVLIHGNPGEGIVLGGLYGVLGPPDSGVVGVQAKRYTLVTPGGQRIRLDDEHQTIRIENSGGTFIELSPEKVRLHAAVDLEIEAPGKAIVLRGTTIDFERV